MSAIGNLFFTTELLLAELIFLHAAPKRDRFFLRYFGAAAACLVAAYFFPAFKPLVYNPFYQLVRFLFLFLLTVGVVRFSFRMERCPMYAACVAGYASQHIAYQVTTLMMHTTLFADVPNRMRVMELITFPVVYGILFLTFGLFVAKNECYKKTNINFNVVSIFTIFICVVLSRVSRYFDVFGTISVSLYTIVCCLLALVIQFVLYKTVDLQHERDTIQRLWEEDRKQFELNKKTIELINIKTHDLKHKLTAQNGQLPQEEIDSIKETIRIFDSDMKTGNEALDVLLTQNSLHCSQEGILLIYAGNGVDLGFMNVMDVYSLFGNAVSNAIEAVRQVEDPEKRIIHIVSERLGDVINIQITNFYSNTIHFEDGIPQTSKTEEPGYHGFGMKSMRLMAEKYGGQIAAKADGEVFVLNIYLLNK